MEKHCQSPNKIPFNIIIFSIVVKFRKGLKCGRKKKVKTMLF